MAELTVLITCVVMTTLEMIHVIGIYIDVELEKPTECAF